MSEYIDETSLTDEEVAAAIAEAKARKAERAKKEAAKPKPDKASDDQTKSLDEKDSDALLDASSTAAQIEAEEDESPAVRSAKSFSNAFAAAKKKREADLLKKREERKPEPEPEDDEDEDEDEDDESELAAAAAIDDDSDDAEFDVDSEEEDEVDDEEDDDADEYEDDEDDEEEDDEDDDEEYEEYDEDEEDGDFDNDGIFETDDENGEYNTTVNVDEDDEEEYEDDEDEEDEDDDESTFSTKTKVIIGVIIAILVIAIIAAFAFFMKGKGGDNDTSSVASVVDGDVTSVKFAEPSVSLHVGETKALQIIVEPADAKDKTFKLKSNDESIVKVNEQGQIIGISSGSTTVTATLKSNPTMTASLVVNVIDEEQSTLNLYNKFVNSILDGSTDIDSDSETDSEITEDENADEQSDTDSSSDTDSEAPKKNVTHKLTGNKIDDFDSDDELELALYYEPTTDNEEPLVRVFKLMDEDEIEDETDSEQEEVLLDEFGNPIETDTDSEEETDSEAPKETDKDKTSSADKVLKEIEPYSEKYMTIHSALEADSAATPWNTSYLEVKEGELATARVRILSSGYEAPVYTYESEDEEVATVDKQGNIKGVKPGTVFITVGSPLNSEAVAKIKVRVKDDTDLLDDYLAAIPVVNNTNDAVFPTETLTGKAIVDIDNDGISELLLRFRYNDNVETINLIKVENEKCVCYKTYHNLSDLYEYGEGDGSYSNSILIHYTTGRVCMDYKGTVAKSGSKSKTSEEKILTIETGGSLTEIVNFKTTTDISTKTVTSEAVVDNTTSTTSSYEDEDSESDTFYEEESDTDSEEETSSYIDEDGDGYDDETGYYFGSFAAFTFDELAEGAENGENVISMTNKKPAKVLPQLSGAPDDEDEEDDDYNDDDYNDNDDGDDDTASEETRSTVTTEVTEETTKYFVNGTPVERSVYEEVLTRYSATYSVWNAWESVY